MYPSFPWPKSVPTFLRHSGRTSLGKSISTVIREKAIEWRKNSNTEACVPSTGLGIFPKPYYLSLSFEDPITSGPSYLSSFKFTKNFEKGRSDHCSSRCVCISSSGEILPFGFRCIPVVYLPAWASHTITILRFVPSSLWGNKLRENESRNFSNPSKKSRNREVWNITKLMKTADRCYKLMQTTNFKYL